MLNNNGQYRCWKRWWWWGCWVYWLLIYVNTRISFHPTENPLSILLYNVVVSLAFSWLVLFAQYTLVLWPKEPATQEGDEKTKHTAIHLSEGYKYRETKASTSIMLWVIVHLPICLLPSCILLQDLVLLYGCPVHHIIPSTKNNCFIVVVFVRNAICRRCSKELLLGWNEGRKARDVGTIPGYIVCMKCLHC